VSSFTFQARALDIRPDWGWAHVERARIHLAQWRYEEALADLDRALELGSEYAEFFPAEAFRNLGRYEEAITAADRLLCAPWTTSPPLAGPTAPGSRPSARRSRTCGRRFRCRSRSVPRRPH
jgi:hypothetical protein